MRLDEVFTLDSVPAQTNSYEVLPAGFYDAKIGRAHV